MTYLERIALEKLQEAANRGEFDNLPNSGQFIDYQEYVAMPAHTRMMYKLLKDSNCVPVEVELMNEVAKLRHELSKTDLPADQRQKLEKVLSLRAIERELRLARLKE